MASPPTQSTRGLRLANAILPCPSRCRRTVSNAASASASVSTAWKACPVMTIRSKPCSDLQVCARDSTHSTRSACGFVWPPRASRLSDPPLSRGDHVQPVHRPRSASPQQRVPVTQPGCEDTTGWQSGEGEIELRILCPGVRHFVKHCKLKILIVHAGPRGAAGDCALAPKPNRRRSRVNPSWCSNKGGHGRHAVASSRNVLPITSECSHGAALQLGQANRRFSRSSLYHGS